ncbi:MFS transporter, ACS family, tartrate transporter [Granulicella pectinivorans]|uniref:MFS transporter, ACS family, tartrate transporter n=1 Tax=Granulicella pectinivorans TaxID=474950 RepID=A0A1I6MP44_9BACT|nr:MFS transporter [Granulicella pectinivorans]SFS17483.1 MFS transporter, ACS family, tartrate transporter [Granulicella pectinivorans]
MTVDVAPASDPVTRSALRKASWRLLPLIGLGYATAYMDRVNISFASLQMNRDLHFSNTVYGFGAGLFFLSYAACEIPSNLLLYRFGARRWLARIMVTWGLIAMAMVFVRTPLQFYAARFFLGMAEAGFFPGVVFYLMQWFPPEQRGRAVSRFYIGFPLSSVFMGLVAGALLNLQGHLGLAGWQWLFIVEGLPAVILGILFFLLLPETPAQAKWLTPEERDAIMTRVPAPKDPSTHALAPAFKDSRVWLLGLFIFFTLASGYAYSFSAPAIVQKVTGLPITNVGYLIAAMSLVGAVAMLISAAIADRRRRPFSHVIPACIVIAAAFVVFGLATNPVVSLTSLLVIVVSNYSYQGPLWSIGSSFLAGRRGAAAVAAMNSIGILGGFLGPYWMGFARDLTGDYQHGLLAMAVPMLLAAGIMIYLSTRSRPA